MLRQLALATDNIAPFQKKRHRATPTQRDSSSRAQPAHYSAWANTDPSCSGDHVELYLEACFDLRGPYGARRRSVRNVLPVDTIQHVVLDAVVDQRMHLD